MKKIIAALLIFCIFFSFVACGTTKPAIYQENDIPADSSQSEVDWEETTEESQQEPSAEEPEAITLQQFLDQVKGIWILQDTLWFFDNGSPSFEALILSDEACTSGVYPGGVAMPGLYEGFAQTDMGIYQIDLLFEETSEDSYWGYSPEMHSSVTFILTGNNTMTLQYSNGTYHKLIYGGKTFEEADATARTLNV